MPASFGRRRSRPYNIFDSERYVLTLDNRALRDAAAAAPYEFIERAWDTKLLGSMRYSGAVGAFEGASYEAHGLYRPQADCIMFTRDPVGFCRVCQRAISRIIDLYSK